MRPAQRPASTTLWPQQRLYLSSRLRSRELGGGQGSTRSSFLIRSLSRQSRGQRYLHRECLRVSEYLANMMYWGKHRPAVIRAGAGRRRWVASQTKVAGSIWLTCLNSAMKLSQRVSSFFPRMRNRPMNSTTRSQSCMSRGTMAVLS